MTMFPQTKPTREEVDALNRELAALREENQRLSKDVAKWKHRAHLFRDAYQEKSCEVTALTLQKLDLESLGDEAMRIQRDRARESAKRMIELATRNLKARAESAESSLAKAQEALRRIIPFAKAHAVQHDCIGKCCPWCSSIRLAEESLAAAELEPTEGKADD